MTRAWPGSKPRPGSAARAALLPLLCLVAARAPAQEPGRGLVHDTFAVHLVFTGDINLGTRTLPHGLPPDSGRRLFDGVDSLLRGDVVVGNFEGVLSDSGDSEKCGPSPSDSTAADSTAADSIAADSIAADSLAPRRRERRRRRKSSEPPPACYAFATPSWLAPRLREAGFTAVNLANNHANDYGLDTRLTTERALRRLGIVPYGPLEEVGIIPVRRENRFMLVGLVGFTTYSHSYNLLHLSRAARVLDSVRPLVDVLVVTFHGGKEGAAAVRTPRGPEFLGREKRGDLRRFARVAINHGADAVVGHGPHVLRGVEFYRHRPIFYSLGNFVTWRGFNLKGPLGLTTALQLDLGGDGRFLGARMPALIQRPGLSTVPDPAGAAVRLLRRVTQLDFPETGARISLDGTVAER